MPAATATPETAKLLAELIQGEMEADDGVVMIYNQKRDIPPAKEGFLVSVAIVGDRPFGANTHYTDPGDPSADLNETVTLNQQEIVQIDIYSYDDSARKRRVEILYALASTAAQQSQERWGYQIGRVPQGFVDMSEVEGNKRLNRYAVTFVVLRAYERTKAAETYDEFSQPQLYTNP